MSPRLRWLPGSLAEGRGSRGPHKSPLWAMFEARVTPDDIRALGITRRSSPRNAYDLVRAGRAIRGGHIPGYHQLIGARLHDWNDFRRVADALSSQQAGHVFEHWLRAHAGHWIGDVRRLRFDKAAYRRLGKSRVTDIWDQYRVHSNSVGDVWEFKYTQGLVDKKQVEDYAELLGETTPDGALVLSVNYVFSNIDAARKNDRRLERVGLKTFYVDDTGVIQRY